MLHSIDASRIVRDHARFAVSSNTKGIMAVVVSDVDRALLWLAARVAGHETQAQAAEAYHSDDWLAQWNPLRHDAHAYALLHTIGEFEASPIHLEIACGPANAPGHTILRLTGFDEIREAHGTHPGDNPGASTRRAITRVIAEYGLRCLPAGQRTKLFPEGMQPATLAHFGATLRQSMEHHQAELAAVRAAAEAERAARIEAERALARVPGSIIPLQGKRLFGRGLKGLEPEVIEEMFEVAKTRSIRLYLLAGNEDWVKQDYLIIHPDDMQQLPRHLGDPFLPLASGQGFSVYQIDQKILQKPFNVLRFC